MNAVRDNLTFLKGALDLLTNATAADTGTTMYLGVTRANATDPGLRLYHSGAATYPRYQVDADGTTSWGDGTAAVDTNLYRSAVNLLKTDDSLEVAARFTCGEQAIKVTAGVPSDIDFGVDTSGNICLDTTNSRIYFRVGTTWKYAALT